MAKKKVAAEQAEAAKQEVESKEVAVNQPEEVAEAVEQPAVEETPAEAPKEEKKQDKKPEVPKTPLKPVTEEEIALDDIPLYAQNVLRRFSNCPELYVTRAGSVFSPDTKPSLRGDAILYKNPFYKH